jgi:hypothetical protein
MMRGPLRDRLQGAKAATPPKPAPPPRPDWTEAKVAAILTAFDSFLHNQAQKHAVPPAQVWDLIRDELLDPGQGPLRGRGGAA